MPLITISPIQPDDNPVIAHIVRSVLTDFGLNKPGTAFADTTLDHLSDIYQTPRSIYYVARIDKEIAGGAGIAPLEGGPVHICELQKMYLLPAFRGNGIARALIEKCLDFARTENYTHCYLETVSELQKAIKLYEYFGFKHLDSPQGNTGHFSCTNWMLKEL
ncbi:putative acetyltransferase [Chitinophaga sp. CF118]|uniref:GNAT family N-acetyltransferase n=1 Tax=Chitinophaga sp. CF118 TaxID=1884367 RepID=UPI0008E0B7BD|nr:GNAT family N-acetyltransferase [Chitinophaga sp. CF118]SFD45334.1 putative acetyltransferase [Chitinophaga sp. CF118]